MLNSPHNDQTRANPITDSLQKNIVKLTVDNDNSTLEMTRAHTSGSKQ